MVINLLVGNIDEMKKSEYTTKKGKLLTIDVACSADAQELIEYVELISGESDYLGFGPGEFGVSEQEEQGILDDYRSSKNKLYMIARVGNEIVGTLSFEAGGRPRMAHCGGIGMSVLKDHWNEGVGSALLDELVSSCNKEGRVKKINLRVRTDNERSICLYKKKGFVKEGTITKDTCVNGQYYDHHLMGLTLND